MEDIYKKVGRRYIKQAVHYPQLLESLPFGFTLVHVFDGGKSYKYQVKPDYVTLLAAFTAFQNRLANLIVDANTPRHGDGSEMSDEVKAAWKKFIEIAGFENGYFVYQSAYDVTEQIRQEILKIVKEEFKMSDNVQLQVQDVDVNFGNLLKEAMKKKGLPNHQEEQARKDKKD